MLGRFINKIWPLKEFLNYLFKKTLGDYILNDLDLNKIELEITNHTFITLHNIQLNAQKINSKHLHSSPIKMLEGRINRLDLVFSTEKIELKGEEVFILLMPVFEKAPEKKNGEKMKIGGVSTDNHVESSIISNLVNSALNGLEVSFKNICVKSLTYEVFNSAKDNPTLSLFLNKIDFRNIPGCKDKNSNASGSAFPKNPETQKMFLFNKQIIFDKICVKLDRNIKNDELTFFQICNLNDEKLLFNFFCENSTVLAFNYMNAEENLFSNENNAFYINLEEYPKDALKISMYVKKVEIFFNPLQLLFLENFVEICGLIFKKSNSQEKENQEDNFQLKEKNTFKVFPIKIFSYQIFSLSFNFHLEAFNLIISENSYAYETPKLWTFYETNYNKQIRTIENLESHFAYTEDNFFIFTFTNLNCDLNSNTNNSHNSDNCFAVDSIFLKYVEYKNKIHIKSEETKNAKKLKFFNSSRLLDKSTNYNNLNNISNLSFSRTNSKGEMSLNQTLYQSVMSGRGESNMFESALESDILLVEKFNKLFEYDYFYNSHPLLIITPTFQSEKRSIKIMLKNGGDNLTGNKFLNEISIGDISLDFHPIFLFKIFTLFRHNSLLLNEIFYFMHDESEKYKKSEATKFSNVVFCDKNNYNNKNDNFNTTSNTTTSKTISGLTSLSQVEIKANEIKISLFSFAEEKFNITNNLNQVNLLSSYFYWFYKQYIEDVENFSIDGEFKERISSNLNRGKLSFIDTMKSKKNITLKVSKPTYLLTKENFNARSKGGTNISSHIYEVREKNSNFIENSIPLTPNYSNSNCNLTQCIGFKQILVYFKEDIILCYDKSEDEFKESSSQSSQISHSSQIQIHNLSKYTQVIDKRNLSKIEPSENDLDYIFKKNTNCYKNSQIIIKESKEFIASKSKKNLILNICLDDEVSLRIGLGVLNEISFFLEDFTFALNIFKMYSKTISEKYKELKLKIFSSYNLAIFQEDMIFNNAEKESPTNLTLTCNLKKINLNLLLPKINSISEQCQCKLNIFDVKLKFQSYDGESEVQMSASSFTFLLPKTGSGDGTKSGSKTNTKTTKINSNKNIPSNNGETTTTKITTTAPTTMADVTNDFIPIIYKSNSTSNSCSDNILDKILNLNVKIKETNKSQYLDLDNEINLNLELKDDMEKNLRKSENTAGLSFEKYLSFNLIQQNDIEIQISISLRDLVLTYFKHFFKEEKTFYLSVIEGIIEGSKNWNHRETNLINLIAEREVDLQLELDVSNLIFDLLMASREEDVKNWSRLLMICQEINHITFDKKKRSKMKIASQAYMKNLSLHLVKNLDIEGSEQLLINKLNNFDKENSIFKYYGFVEISNLEKVELKIIKEDEGLRISFLIGALELNFCKDSFASLVEILNNIKNVKEEILKIHKTGNNKNNRLEQTTGSCAKIEKPYININENKSENLIQIFDDYCEGGDYMKDVILLTDEQHLDSDAQVQNKSERKRKRSDFDIVTKDSEEFKITLNQGDIILTIIVSSFRLYLFKGKDFDFLDSKSKEIRINSNNVNNRNPILGNWSLVNNSFNSLDPLLFNRTVEFCPPYMIENYFENLVFKNEKCKSLNRERNKFRDYDNHIGLNLQNLNFEGVFYNNFLVKNEVTKNTEKNFTIKLNLEKFDIDDYVKVSKYKKIVSKFDYEEDNNFMEFSGEMIRSLDENILESKVSKSLKFMNKVDIEDSEFYGNLKIANINFLLDQATLVFLMDFFNLKFSKDEKVEPQKFSKNLMTNSIISSNESDKNEIQEILNKENESNHPVKLTFVRKIKINEFFINFSYNSHSLSISKLKNKNYLELLNLSNIADFRIILKQIDFLGCKTIPDTLEMITNFWKEDITKNQIFSAILQSVSVIRPITTMLEGFLDIFKQPWIYYKTEKSFKKGISKGLKNFVLSFTSQTLFIGEKLYTVVKNYLGNDERNPTTTLNKNSYYKKFLYYIDVKKQKYDDYYLKK